MEVTKKMGGPDPSGPQGHPSASSQQLGGGLSGSQGHLINSGSRYFRQGLSLSNEAMTDGAYGPSSQAYIPELIHQLPQDPAEVGSHCGCEWASQDAPRLSSPSLFPSPNTETQVHLIMDNKSLALPLFTHSDSTSDMVQHGCHSWFQVQVARKSKAPAKVLVGWGKGSCMSDQTTTPLGIRKSQWLPGLVSAEDGSAAAQGPFPSPASDQGQGRCLYPAQVPPAPTETNTPALDPIPLPGAVEPYTCSADHFTKSTAITKSLSEDNLIRKCGNQRLDRTNCCSQEQPPTAAATAKECPHHAQEPEGARKQVGPKQPKNPAEKLLVYASRPGNPAAVSGTPGTPKSLRSSHVRCSHPVQHPLNVRDNTCSSVPLSADQVTCHTQSPVQSPREAMQSAPSDAPSCQLWDTQEDHVLVFDMATGNTRMGLMCHDPMGSRAVLVGLMPNHPSIHASENMLSTRPLAMPVFSPDRNRSSFWSTSATLSSPVPSSLSSGSYREVSLVPKEARLNLESQVTPGTESPTRVGMLTRPIPLGTPPQLGERTPSHVHQPGWSKPDAEKDEFSRTIWMLDASGMQDTPVVQAKQPQWMNAEQTHEPVPSAKPQEAPRALPQGGIGRRNLKETITAHPDNPLAEGAGQAHLHSWPPLAEQHPAAGRPLPTGQPPSSEKWPFLRQTHLPGYLPVAEQPPSIKQPPLPGQPPFTGAPLVRQLSLTGQPLFPREPPISKEPILLRGPTTTTRKPGQASVPCQKGEPLGLPTHVGVLRGSLAPQKTCVYVSNEKMGTGAAPSSSTHRLSSWQPGSSHRAQEEQLSLITFTTPGTGCRVLPMATVSTKPQSSQFKQTEKDIPGSAKVTHLDLLRGACYELVPTKDDLPVQSPLLCRHLLGPYENMKAVVIDTGTGFTKCGLAGEDHVLSVVPSRVQLLQQSVQGQPRYVVPDNLEGSCSVLNRGVVSDWDALEVLWQHLFYCSLGMQPEELAVLVADSPISPRTNREKVAEILFECFHVPAMQTVHQALLALYAYGRTTGLVLGSGHGTSYVAPILTGDLAPLDTYRLDVAGADLTEYLAQLLLAGGHSPLKASLVNQIKEACCYVTRDMAAEMAHAETQARVDFVLPDKQVIKLGSERFRCPEALFQPSLLGLNQPGLPQLALLSISRLEAKQQEQLLANVVLDGGSTLVSGFPERLRQELGPCATVLASPHRAVAAWLGGSIMVSQDSFRSLWLSRREYEEEGPWAIYKYHL